MEAFGCALQDGHDDITEAPVARHRDADVFRVPFAIRVSIRLDATCKSAAKDGILLYARENLFDLEDSLGVSLPMLDAWELDYGLL